MVNGNREQLRKSYGALYETQLTLFATARLTSAAAERQAHFTV